ncbi:hypothetical protein LCGC14_3036250 [marine sediment metagenome]|uniref:Uncharacterized protein n=1 Tax=marine sediment metagenome TaxID=412755 RepID=A0A0F8WQN7_9ZZZZ
MTTHDLLNADEKAQLRHASDSQLLALADLAVITERCLKIGNPEREQAITVVVLEELKSRGIHRPGRDCPGCVACGPPIVVTADEGCGNA